MKSTLSTVYYFFKQQPIYVLVLFVLCASAGSLIRFSGLFNLGFIFDTITTQHAWARNSYEMGFWGFWQNYDGFFDYLPGSLLWLQAFYGISRIPFINQLGEWQSFIFAMKAFYWLVEIALSYLVFAVARKYRPQNPALALTLAGLTYVNPSLWFVSGQWGQMDGLIATLSIVTLLVLYAPSAENLPWYRTNVWWAGVLWGIAVWTKMQAVLLLPIILLFFFWNKKVRQILFTSWYVVPFFGILLLGLNPFSHPFYFSEHVQIWGVVVLVLTYIIQSFWLKNNILWGSAHRFFLGFWLVTAAAVFNTIFLNVTRLGSTAGAMFLRKSSVSEGAASAYNIFNLSGEDGGKAVVNTLLIDAGTWTFSIGQFATICLAISMLLVLYGLFSHQNLRKVITNKTQLLNSFHLSEAFLALFMLNLAYFIFSTKMHSRYFHIGIALIPFLLIFSNSWKNKAVLILALILVNFSYLANQFSVMAAQQGDSEFYKNPAWLYTSMDTLKFDLNQIATVGNLIATIVLIGWYISRKGLVKTQS